MSTKTYILRRLLKYSSPIISIFEKQKIKKLNTKSPNFQPIFIIGPPRSGSTILFQILTNYLDVIYINNLVNMAKRNPYFGFLLSNKFIKSKSHNTFDSKYGKIKIENLAAPNEGLFWYKWLNKKEHYSDENSLNNQQKINFRNTVFAIINKYQKPFLIKNLSFSVRIKLLHDIFPEAKYIYIKRNPLYVAQSILLAKEKLHIPDNEIWSIRPKNYKNFEKSGKIKQIVCQIKGIEEQIKQDKTLIKNENFYELSYEDFCKNTEKYVTDIHDFTNCNLKIKNKISSLEIRDKIKIDNQLFEKLKQEIEKEYKNDK